LDECWLGNWCLDRLGDWDWGWGWDNLLWGWLAFHHVVLGLTRELHVFSGVLNKVLDVFIWVLSIIIVVVILDGLRGS